MHRAHFVLYFLFFTGWFFSLLARAYATVSSKLNGVDDYPQYFKIYAVPIVGRLFLSVVSMMFWILNPLVFSTAVLKLLPGDWTSVLGSNPLPLNPVTAALYGYLVDSLLDKVAMLVPSLRKEIPLAPATAPAPAADNKGKAS